MKPGPGNVLPHSCTLAEEAAPASHKPTEQPAMKTESEIRNHMKNLMVCINMPCQCRGTDHEYQCVVGGNMMRSSIATMQWILGENEEHQATVDRMAEGARDYIASG